MKALKEKILKITISLILLALAFSTNTKLVMATSKIWPSAKVTINKPKGVNCPDLTFEVVTTPIGVNGGIDDEKSSTNSTKILFEFSNGKKVQSEEYMDGERLSLKSKAQVDFNDYWTYGDKTYLVSQISGNDEFTTYSKATYFLTVSDQRFPGSSARYLWIRRITDDDGNPVNEGKEPYQKFRDRTPFVFNNYYDKKDGNENPTPGSQITEEDKKGFSLRKTIIGENPSKTYEFEFKFKLDKPKISKSSDTEFNYYIVKNDGSREKKVASYDTVTSINLRHNERLVLGKVLLGSKLTVNETDPGLYNGSITESKFFEWDGQTNTGIIGEQEGGNFVEYENQMIAPTGLLIDNLPFVIVVLVAGLGIIFFVRNSRKEEYLG